MEVTEERLGEVLARGEPGAHLSSGSNAVPSLVVESMAATHPEHAERIREAGHFLCGLLWAHDGDGDPTLTLSVAMHTFLREERTTPARMRAHLSRTTHRDLLLGLSAHALLSQRRGPRRYGRGARETEAVLRTLYLLVRMYETQEGTATPSNGRWRRHESREEASMILWWIGNILLIVVVVPVVAALLRDVLTATKEIHSYATDALEHLNVVHSELNASINELNTTRNGVKSLAASTQQYGQALDRVL